MQYHIINSKYVHVKQVRLTHEVKIQKKKKPYSWISDKNTDIYKKHTTLKNTNKGCQKHAKCKEESDKMSKSAILYLFVAEILSIKIKNNVFKVSKTKIQIKKLKL